VYREVRRMKTENAPVVQRALDHYVERMGMLCQDEEIKLITTKQIRNVIEKCKSDFTAKAQTKGKEVLEAMVLKQYLTDLTKLRERAGKQVEGYDWKTIEDEQNEVNKKLKASYATL